MSPRNLSPFLCVPSEIRLMIYDLLFDDKGQKTLEIRNQSPDEYRHREKPFRTSYRVLGKDLVRQSFPTTYYLVTDAEIHASIMGVNRKIHEETTHMFYGSHSFSFARDIEAIVPFFSDLTLTTRPLIREIALVKQGSVYSRDYDRCEWRNLCELLRESMQLKRLNLIVEGGRPSLGWDGLKEFTIADFKTMRDIQYEPLEWVWELLSIKGIQNLDIGSEIRHCPPAHSNAMAFFATFSSSIEKGFAEYLQGQMVV
ncbi:hypothetical protein D0Z07_4021 [Hyphodiscus hymeniophilus]|uniref:Uncharacterized protein n=1 Tax=Hyphodiscus hymeniophilus TaxID=353542 RepID=A0A9P7AXG8_9HELO|nr:hypothetical protein D0Z07_4021 [Hyphodiscus hymeniophilus]